MIPRAQAGWEQELELAGGEEATASLVSGSGGGGGGRRLKRKTPESVAALLGNLMGPSGALGNLGVGAPSAPSAPAGVGAPSAPGRFRACPRVAFGSIRVVCIALAGQSSSTYLLRFNGPVICDRPAFPR